MSGLVQDTPSQTGHGGAETLAWVGRLAAPPLALAAYTLLPAEDGLTPAGRATAAVLVLMAVLWMTEAMPLPATALMPLVLFPVVGVLSIRETAAAYAHEVIFLLMGGFMIGRAMERWNLHRRLALGIVSVAGTRPTRLVAGFMVATAFLPSSFRSPGRGSPSAHPGSSA